MEALLLVSVVLLWTVTIALALVILGLLRQIAVLRWRLEQVAATTPSRIERNGLKVGTRAPAFALERVGGGTLSLAELAGHKALVVFTEPACGPCGDVVPALNALQRKAGVEVIAISNGDPEASRLWAQDHDARFPVLCQLNRQVSRRYGVFATPFAFLIDEGGSIAAQGIVNNEHHIRFLLASAHDEREPVDKAPRPNAELHGAVSQEGRRRWVSG